jgi:signal transduction histidine kinase
MTSDVSRWPPGLRRRLGGVLLAVTAGVVDLLVWGDDRRLAEGVPVWAVPAATALMCALLLARRRHPLPVLGAQAGYALVNLAIPHYEPFACLLVALHAVAAYCAPRAARLGLLVCAAPFALFSYRYAQFTPGDEPLQFVVAAAAWALIAGVVWGLGRLAYVREQHAEAERRRLAAEAERALEAERLRLARELHDSVTGAVTAMILYSAGARAQLSPDEEQVHDALRVVERAGTQAMNELHRMLGLLRTPDGGTAIEAGCRPELAALDELVERTRSGGLDITLAVDGQARQLDPSIDQAAYRVVQESLTNAIKHAGPGARVEVTLTWRSTDLVLDIRSTGGGPSIGTVRSSGYGLRGLTERVHLVGGSLTSGPADGGWLVHAELPIAERPPDGSVGPPPPPNEIEASSP